MTTAAARREYRWQPKARRALGVPALAAMSVVAFGVILIAHGLLPGEVKAGPDAYLTEGAILCEHGLGLHALTSSCHAYGEPVGFPLLINGPVIALGTIAMWLGAGVRAAYLASAIVIDLVALAGGYALARRLTMSRPVALWAAALYLISPTIVGLISFPGTFAGFELLPCYALADLVMLEALGGGRSRRTLAIVIGGYLAVRSIALFIDGYSFVASLIVTACFYTSWVPRQTVRSRRWLPLGVILAANGVAVLIYTVYQPGTYPLSPLPVFRSMGLDVVSLVSPSGVQWLPSALGLTWTHDLWGLTNNTFNYLAVGCLGLAVIGVRARFGGALAVAAVIALVLSLGPALKVNDGMPSSATSPYSMPASAATAELPWGSLFVKVPGVDETRATYRWFGVTRFGLVFVAALGLERLLRRRRWRIAVVAVATLATAELFPNLPALSRTYRATARQATRFNRTVVPELRSVTRPGERVFFLSYDGDHDDFLANYLSPLLHLRTFNAGGDKNSYISAQRWPAQVAALAPAQVPPAAVYAALASHEVDVVIAPYFELSDAASQWPPSAGVRARAQRTFAPIVRDSRLSVQRRSWLAAIRLRPGS